MQQYIFRGKVVGSDKWVYGSLLQRVDSIGALSLIEVQGKEPPFEIDTLHVLPESVGMWTGLKGYTGTYEDRRKNEVMLFEGDIVEAMSEGWKGTFIIKWRQESVPCFILYPAWQSRKMWSIHASCLGRKEGDYYDDLKLIGNITDHPHLLNPAARTA